MSLKLFVFVTLVSAATAAIKPHRGYVLPLFDTRIVGGYEAKPGEFPWQVSLQWGWLFGYSHFCGGSLLNSQWILTAGHCAEAVPTYGDLVAILGKHNLREKEPSQQTVKVSKMFIHEQYKGDVGPYDIALMKLENPVKLTKAIQPISLPKAASTPAGTAILTGWGSTSRTSSPSMPDKLQTAPLPIINLDACRKALEELTGPSPLHSTNVCTGPLTGGFSACNGDSGGPLILNNNGRPEVVGIVSWGIVPCGSVGAPSVYTRTSAYIDWITNIMSKN